jgi:hypothetical protein
VVLFIPATEAGRIVLPGSEPETELWEIAKYFYITSTDIPHSFCVLSYEAVPM